MKTIMAILMTMVMALALVPCASAATFVPTSNMAGPVYLANSTSSGAMLAQNGSVAAAGYSCVSTPAYTGYVNVHPVFCPANGAPLQTPRVMGAVW